MSYCVYHWYRGRERRQVQMLIKTLSLWVSAPLSSFTLAGQHGQTILHKYQSMQNFVQILWHSKMWLNHAPKYKGRHNGALIYISHYARSDHTWWWSHMIRSNISEPEWSLHIKICELQHCTGSGSKIWLSLLQGLVTMLRSGALQMGWRRDHLPESFEAFHSILHKFNML